MTRTTRVTPAPQPPAEDEPVAAGPARRPWWRDAAIYQVYVRSFADADGDGTGDLPGLAARLDHLTRLGVDGFWLNPCYPSPGADGGYDVADYMDIGTEYGGLAAFEALLADAHRRGLRVLMDLVPNHCSVRHLWFVEALAASPGSPQRDRFIFRTGRGADGGEPPNNWRSVFGGPAWTRVPGSDQWYLHSFDAGQPDFNWRSAEVGDYFERVLRFWFDRGVDGMRIDVAHMMLKREDLADWPYPSADLPDYNAYSQNQPEVHDVHRRWRRVADSYGRDLTLVGEVWVPTVEDLAPYLRPDELPQAFYFDLLMTAWHAPGFRASIDRALSGIAASGATVTWTLANHDVHRAVTRYGLVTPGAGAAGDGDLFSQSVRTRGEVDVARGTRRAAAALVLLLGLPGSVYLYQGEELGLPEVLDMPDDARRDPIWFRSGGTDAGRDGCRVPLPWTASGPTFGFADPVPGGRPAAPWLPQPSWFGRYAVDREWDDPGSMLNLYADALALRRELLPAVAEQPLSWLDVPGRDDVTAYRRGPLVVVTVFGTEPFAPPAGWGTVRLASAPVGAAGALAGESSAWLLG